MGTIGLVVSEEKIFEKVYDVRRTPSDGKSSRRLWPGELKTLIFYFATNNKKYVLLQFYVGKVAVNFSPIILNVII